MTSQTQRMPDRNTPSSAWPDHHPIVGRARIFRDQSVETVRVARILTSPRQADFLWARTLSNVGPGERQTRLGSREAGTSVRGALDAPYVYQSRPFSRHPDVIVQPTPERDCAAPRASPRSVRQSTYASRRRRWTRSDRARRLRGCPAATPRREVLSRGCGTTIDVGRRRRTWATTLVTTHAFCNCNRNCNRGGPRRYRAKTAKGPVSCITAGHGPVLMAEDGGFEPPRACTQHAFQLR